MSRYMPDPPERFPCDLCGRTIAEPDALVCGQCDVVYCEQCSRDQGEAGEQGLCDACLNDTAELHEDRAASLALARRAEQREDDYREDNKR